jgi:predicted YcjX-like family ATPase
VRRGGGGGGGAGNGGRGGGDALPCILGVPAVGEQAGGQTFDGRTEVAVFPGDLPADPNDVFAEGAPPFRGLAGAGSPADADFRFVRFRPPPLEMGPDGAPALPHIRLDRALQFLIGDRL